MGGDAPDESLGGALEELTRGAANLTEQQRRLLKWHTLNIEYANAAEASKALRPVALIDVDSCQAAFGTTTTTRRCRASTSSSWGGTPALWPSLACAPHPPPSR